MDKLTKGERKRLRRDRRRWIVRMVRGGLTVGAMARWLGCEENTVRQHVSALRAAARREVAERVSSGLADGPGVAGELVAGLEEAWRKVRAAQPGAPAGDLRQLLRLEVQTIRQLTAAWRELSASARLEGGREPEREWGEDWPGLSDEELLVRAKELGIDTTGYERALRLSRAA